jgi:hypothetical protein
LSACRLHRTDTAKRELLPLPVRYHFYMDSRAESLNDFVDLGAANWAPLQLVGALKAKRNMPAFEQNCVYRGFKTDLAQIVPRYLQPGIRR